MLRKQAVVFGAGSVARGLLGHLLSASGYTTTFVARRPEVVAALNRRRGYHLRHADERGSRVAVRDCVALDICDRAGVAGAVACADVVFTAVGIDNLAAITDVIAAGLWRRDQDGGAPLNVIACENLPGAGAYLGHQILAAAPAQRAPAVERIGGFSAAITRRIMTEGAADEIVIAADPRYDLVIDAQGLKGDAPAITGAVIAGEFSVMVMRKLFTLNCAHAVAAYLGHRHGCRFIHEAAAHPGVAPVLRAAVDEARMALRAELPRQADAIDRDAAEALERIANPRLADPIGRVARQPRRKLSPRERLVGPARLAAQHGLLFDHLALAIAAALAYDAPDDPQAQAMRREIAREGLDCVLTEDCGLLPHDPLARAVKRHWAEMNAGQPAEAAGATPLEEIMQAVASDLSHRHDPRVVWEVLNRVAEEFEHTRICKLHHRLLRSSQLYIQEVVAGFADLDACAEPDKRRVYERLGGGAR